MRRCLPARHPVPNRRQHPGPQIHRKRSGHVCRPPDPADSLNRKIADSGIPAIPSARKPL
jgi:hypothetical protein